LLNNYHVDSTNRSISDEWLFSLMPENNKEWWIGLPKELQIDIEIEDDHSR